MREIDEKAVQAAEGKIGLDDFILEFEPFILHAAAKVSGKFITKADDEWPIALEAFFQAVFSYSMEKGAFISFATLLIKRRYIDYMRTQSKRISEISVDPGCFEDGGEDEIRSAITAEISQKMLFDTENQLKDIRYEIESAGAVFDAYGFTFYELSSCSPKSQKTKAACAKVVLYILNHSVVLEQMKTTRMLPLKTIEKTIGTPRKVMENHRKYIIAAVEILRGEYPYLSEYLKYIREEPNS